ncbi:MAG: hypothetical protein GX913_06755 [Clostridiales bacterium]|nr:hypothetical protein [Clostridiales bacterium]
MKINGFTNSVTTATQTPAETKVKNTNTELNRKNIGNDTGVVYESSKKPSKVSDPDLVAKLKADAELRTSQFRQLVENMLLDQGKVAVKNDDFWKILAKGDFTVDKETADAAAAEIAEDGYWGVEQTSDRILSFAEALTGGDPKQMEKMRDAFIKGYKEATKSWGKELPDISSRTYDAVMKKFDNHGKEGIDSNLFE